MSTVKIESVENALRFSKLSHCVLVLLVLHVTVRILVVLQHLLNVDDCLGGHHWQRLPRFLNTIWRGCVVVAISEVNSLNTVFAHGLVDFLMVFDSKLIAVYASF